MPHFAERDEKTNAFRQQDAHECWSAIVSTLAQTLKVESPQSEEVRIHTQMHYEYYLHQLFPPKQGAAQQLKFMDQYFGRWTVELCVHVFIEIT